MCRKDPICLQKELDLIIKCLIEVYRGLVVMGHIPKPTHVKSVDRKHPKLQKRIVDEIDELYLLRRNIYLYKKLVSYICTVTGVIFFK